jgi:hypothetical protein
MAFPAQPPDLHRPSFGRESFAFHCTLALLGSASYPVSVRRLDGFATPLLSALPSREVALRLASVPTTKFREDFHLQTIAHAGHTMLRGGSDWSPLSFLFVAIRRRCPPARRCERRRRLCVPYPSCAGCNRAVFKPTEVSEGIATPRVRLPPDWYKISLVCAPRRTYYC